MKRVASALSLAALMVGVAFAAGSGPAVDGSDMPKMDQTRLCQNLGDGGDSAKWAQAETRFMNCLNTQEREGYQQMKQLCDQIRTQVQAFKDSVSGLTIQQRTQAIEAKKAQIRTAVQNMQTTIEERMTMEQKQAKTQRRAEIEKKRQEVKKHLEAVKTMLQDRLQQGGN